MIDLAKHKSCQQVIIDKTELTKQQLDSKALLIVCDYPYPKQ